MGRLNALRFIDTLQGSCCQLSLEGEACTLWAFICIPVITGGPDITQPEIRPTADRNNVSSEPQSWHCNVAWRLRAKPGCESIAAAMEKERNEALRVC